MRVFLTAVFVTLLSVVALAQDEERRQPDVPGSIQIDLGFNIFQDMADTTKAGFWGSKVANIYYMYDLKFGENSRFSFNPGIGVGLEKLDFDRAVTLINVTDSAQVQVAALSSLYPGRPVKKSKIAINYVDVPLELRFHSNRYDHNRGFRAAIGGKVGFLFNAHTKIKLDQSDTNRKIKDADDYRFSRFRYGLIGRIGVGNFSLYYYQSLSEVFESGAGPEGSAPTSFQVGLSITGF